MPPRDATVVLKKLTACGDVLLVGVEAAAEVRPGDGDEIQRQISNRRCGRRSSGSTVKLAGTLALTREPNVALTPPVAVRMVYFFDTYYRRDRPPPRCR